MSDVFSFELLIPSTIDLRAGKAPHLQQLSKSSQSAEYMKAPGNSKLEISNPLN